MSISKRSRAFVVLGLAAAVWAGCNDNELGVEKRHPNQSPSTLLSSSPPDSTYATRYKVELYWTGGDPDGTIDHYDYILVDHDAIEDSIRTADPGSSRRVVVTVPEVNDPRWTSTTNSDTIIVTRADTLRQDPSPPPGAGQDQLDFHNRMMRRQSFERWHTFFVRAVDNEGGVDPTPDYRSFNSRTVAPSVALQKPIELGREFHAPPTIVFNWVGLDDEGDGVTQQPIASRWVFVPTRKLGQEYIGFPDTLYDLPRSAWSPWRPWNARDGSGKRAIVRDRTMGFYMFAVQAMDEAGAVTPVFDDRTLGHNNVSRLFVSGDVGPRLRIHDRYLGEFSFTSGAGPQPVDIAASQPVQFCWEGDASTYGGTIVAYRWAWDLRNPDNDDEWAQNWSETAICAPSRNFPSGTHTFYVEARDNAESVTRGRIEMIVRQVTRGRDLLIIDDTAQPSLSIEDREDRRWLEVVDSLQAQRSFAFDRTRDVYDISERNNRTPPIELLFDYKTVVWNVIANSNGSAMRRVARLVDPFAEGQATSTFNYLNLFLENRGEMWVTGIYPTFELAPITDTQPQNALVPISITHWGVADSAEDSVGVSSTLYRMGIEAMDIGNGSNVPRPRGDEIHQGCIGFRRFDGQTNGAQTYVSSAILDHAHLVTIAGSDIQTPPAGGVTYTTTLQAAHTHELTLSQAQLRELRLGQSVVDSTDTSALPEPHLHRFEFVDNVGIWGAPAFLEPDTSTWPLPALPVNPGGRSGIEIYNMPSFFDRPPRTAPPPERVLTLYTYVSLTPADHENGRLYPDYTADEQPAFILSKATIFDAQFTRAYCGFEPWRLRHASHVKLAQFVLLRHMRLGLPDQP